MGDALKQRRLDVLAEHFQSEVDHDWDACISTFNGHPRYEIMPTGQVFDGEEAVRNYHRRQREAFPDQRHENARFHCADDDTVIAEFELLGTNTGPLLGRPPTGKAFRVPASPSCLAPGPCNTDGSRRRSNAPPMATAPRPPTKVFPTTPAATLAGGIEVLMVVL